MAIRNAASGKSGGIGPVRYVEKGVTVNIQVGYVVEGGKTALVYSEKLTYQPSGEYVYLYKEGVTSDLVGGWNFVDRVSNDENDITFTENDTYLSLLVKQGDIEDKSHTHVRSANMIDISNYHRVCTAYEIVGTLEANNFSQSFTEDGFTEGGFYFGRTAGKKIREYDLTNYYFTEGYIDFDLDNGYDALSTTEDVELRIYAIWLERTPSPS